MKMNSIKNYFQSPIKDNVNSKTIENMTAVLKKGKKRRKRNKEVDNNERVISDISITLSNNLNFEAVNISTASESSNEMYSPPEFLDDTEEKTSKIKNVFEIMMDARNRVIGNNSDGIVLDIEPVEEKTSTSLKNKRKLLLEKWCEDKGKKERMLKEEAEMELINKKMEKRAHRLKKLLTNGNETNKNDANKQTTKIMAKKQLELDVENEATSPTNKGDILGYFPKLHGRLEEKNENIRPRRSCAINKSYTFDLSPPKKDTAISPTKTTNKKTKRSLTITSNAQSKKQKLDSDDGVEITIIDVEKMKIPNGELKNVKLAPLFIKQIPKPAIDPVVLKARQDFLMSGIPESMRLEITRQKTFANEYELKYSCFPEISHITQLNSIYNEYNVGNSEIHFLTTCSEMDVVLKYDRLKLGILTNCDKHSVVSKFSNYNKEQHAVNIIPRKNLITLVKELKSDCNNYPVYRCYKQLKLKCNPKKTKPELNQNMKTKNKAIFSNGCQLYNEMFKPTCLNEIYINYRQAVELKRFLSNWQENYYSHKENDDSLSNSLSSVNATSNFIVLIGPYGCGKTNSVYAMAHEMNFKVLEINCGSTRTGKRMLQKLHEATQSHNVHKHNTNSQKADDTDSRNETDINIEKLALVLIEDSDIVFEQDDGFINAINQLISNSKRPVILVSNNPFSNHLLKFIEQNSIIYDAPSLINMTKYISLIGLVENCFLDYGELEKLIRYNQNDLRRTINMVQFFIQSGADRQTLSNPNKENSTIRKVSDTFGLSEMLDVEDDNSKFSWYNSDEETISKPKSTSSVLIHKHTQIFDFFIREQNNSSKFKFYGNFNTLWLNLPAIFLAKHNSTSKAKENFSKIEKIKQLNTLNQISNFYDHISAALVLDTENINQDFSYSSDLSKEIVSTIVEYSMDNSNVDYNKYELLLNKNHESLDLLYNSLSGNYGSNNRIEPTASVALDYEPYLRSICRMEKDRKHDTDRRSTRFYHYLRNLVSTYTFGTEHFDKYTNILNHQFY